jgi:hypothetical protein
MATALEHRMKTRILLLGAIVAMALGTMTEAQAHPDGYWDRGGHWRHYGYYHHHHGYWDQRNGGRIWINID